MAGSILLAVNEMTRSTLVPRAFACLALSAAAIQFSFLGQKQPVKTISTEQLLEMQAAEERTDSPAKFVLVDVRSPKEQSISMIPGAITAQQFEENQTQYWDRTVIAYCTVGVRSEHYARKLIASGQSALNFKDSILGWCAASYPLVTPDGKPTQRVHTYSARYKVSSEYEAVY